MKTLIIYASKYGYTKDCVGKLKQQLQGDISVVNVMTDNVPLLERFDNVIIGGSIYMGQIHKKLKVYCSQNVDMLTNKRIALFLCCGLPDNLEQHLSNSFPEELLKKALIKECFGGELRTEKMNLVHKMITGIMKKAAAKDGKPELRTMPESIVKLAECMNHI